jgi:hypothetical protein
VGILQKDFSGEGRGRGYTKNYLYPFLCRFYELDKISGRGGLLTPPGNGLDPNLSILKYRILRNS